MSQYLKSNVGEGEGGREGDSVAAWSIWGAGATNVNKCIQHTLMKKAATTKGEGN